MDITRREAVRRLALLLGGTASASTVAAVLSGCEAAPPPPDWAPTVLSEEQLDVLTVVVDRILPPTDTPGAAEAGVPAYIDGLMDRWVEPGEQERVRAGLDALAAGEGGTPFLDASPEEQVALLERLDREAVVARASGVTPLPTFGLIKEWTLAGYYTSEIGATRELQWIATPGRLEGDLPLDQVGRTWA